MSLSSAIKNSNFPTCFVVVDDFKPGMSTLRIYNAKGQLIGIMKKLGNTWKSHTVKGSQLKIKVNQADIEPWDNATIMFVRTLYATQGINI